MRPPLLYASLLSALLLSGCGDGQSGAAGAPERARSGAGAVAAAATQAVVLKGPIANFTFNKNGDSYLVTDTTGAEAPRTVAATARLRFDDMSMSFDADGLPGQAYRLYRAAFARVPDAAGLGYWIGVLDQGGDLHAMAQGFVDSNEYKDLYRNAKSNADYVNQYYVNVLNRQGEAAGIDYWSGVLDSKADSLAGVLKNFSEGQENRDGTAAATQAGIRYLEYGFPYPANQPVFPLRAAYQRLMTAHTDYMTVSGNCTGTAAFTYGAPDTTTFEGQNATALQNTVTVGLTTCSPTRLSWSLVDYYDSNNALLGSTRQGTEYSVGAPAGALPATAKVGDSGTYATQALYGDSGKQGSPGKRTIGYMVGADGDSHSTAILALTAVHTTAAGATSFTRTSRYRIGTDQSLQALNVEEWYSNNIHLLYTRDTANVQPAGLTITDTVTGSGALAQAGQILTVHYTGWLYVPTAAGFKGMQFDSSVGRAPFTFTLGASQVIQGWDQGFAGMKVGGRRTLLIPSSLGYGAYGSGAIPGNAALVFEVELVGVK